MKNHKTPHRNFNDRWKTNFISDALEEKGELQDNIDDSAYENLQIGFGNQARIDNNLVAENPYYEADIDVQNDRNQNRSGKDVNLEDTQVVTSVENIYYDI